MWCLPMLFIRITLKNNMVYSDFYNLVRSAANNFYKAYDVACQSDDPMCDCLQMC